MPVSSPADAHERDLMHILQSWETLAANRNITGRASLSDRISTSITTCAEKMEGRAQRRQRLMGRSRSV